MRRFQRLALAAVAAASLALPGAAAEPAGSLRANLSLGYDSNARRVYNSTPADADAMGSLLLDGAARISPGPLDLAGSYTAGARKFLVLSSQDTLIQEAKASLGVQPLGTVQLAVDGRLKDRRGGPRRYTDLQGSLALRWQAVPELEVELHGGAHRFIYWTVFEYSFSSPEAGGRVRFRLDRRHTLWAGGDLGHRRYNMLADMEVTSPDPPEVIREDAVLTAAAGYVYRGAFQLSAGYQYFNEDSNSYGETLHFHRVELALGTPLPWNLLLFAQLALQLGDLPEGVVLSKGFFLYEDDEQHSSLSLKLVRPLGERVDVELRYAAYSDVLRQNGYSYLRQVATVGLSARM